MKEKIYQFIMDYIIENGFAHSIREIGQEVNISICRVAHHLTMLEIEGRIEMKQYCPRAIRVIKKSEEQKHEP